MAEDMGLRERKRQRTRQALISAAMRLFEEKGYEQTTVAEIAASAEVSTKTFFNHFASKDEVLFRISQPASTTRSRSSRSASPLSTCLTCC